ncbi:hypothetical protein RHSIM_Rhsim02G0074100 [Rhododendron simsii]|uniref:DUF4219 domain-containing protein n=1 Tax=Rhododendron simsii TaxID=118357 RepID=A0A834LYU4_RHOSS|nr:hypothetical protein RHSIM_Rhsim02G0074100 [Rhododendron simsii]
MSDFSMNTMVLFSATNYAIWKLQMEDMHSWKDLYDPLEYKGVKPTETKMEDWKKLNRKAIGLIRQCNGQEVFHHLALETDAYALWMKLESMYYSKILWNKVLPIRIRRPPRGSPDQGAQTLVVSQSNSVLDGKLVMSMVKDALFNEEARQKEWEQTMRMSRKRLLLVSTATRRDISSGIAQGMKRRKDVHRDSQRKGTGILRIGASNSKKRASFALDLVSGGDLSGVVNTGGGKDPPRMARRLPVGQSLVSAVSKQNLSMGDYRFTVNCERFNPGTGDDLEWG